MCAPFLHNVGIEHTYGVLKAFVKAGILNIDFNLVSIFSIRKAALITSEINNDNKPISLFKIYPSTLNISVKNNTCFIFTWKNEIYSFPSFII